MNRALISFSKCVFIATAIFMALAWWMKFMDILFLEESSTVSGNLLPLGDWNMDQELEEMIRRNCSSFNFVTIPDELNGRLAHVMSQVYILFVFMKMFNHAKATHGQNNLKLHGHVAAIPKSRIKILRKVFQRPVNLTFVTKEFVEETCGRRNWLETSLPTWNKNFQNISTNDVFFNTWPMPIMRLSNNSDIYNDLFQLLPELTLKARFVLQDIVRRQFYKTGSVPDEFVFVHVRRTDYAGRMVKRHKMSMYTGMDIDHMINSSMKSHPNATYIIFSDDKQWCKDNVKSLTLFDNVILAPDTEPEVAFATMASCDDGIATLGSFALWAGILSGGHLTRLVPRTDTNRERVQNIDERLVNHEFVYFPK